MPGPWPDNGAALMVEEKDLTGEILATWINRFLVNPGKLDRMAARAAEHGNPHADTAIVADIYKLLTPDEA